MKFHRRPFVLGLPLALLFSLLPPAVAAAAGGTGTLAGRVVERESSAGIASASVRLYDAASRQRLLLVRADSDGNFQAAHLAPGDYLVAAGAPGREWQAFEEVSFFERDEAAALLDATPVTVPENGRLDLEPLRLRQLGRIAGRILDAESGAPIAGARVYLFTGDLEPRAGFAMTGADGSFLIEDLVPDTYYLLADGPGMRDLLVGGDEACVTQVDDYRYFAGCDPTRGTPFTISSGETIDAGGIALPAEGRVRGTVRLGEDRALWPHVRIYNSGNRQLADFYPTVSLREWSFDLPVPGGGTYHLAADANEHLIQVYDHLDCVTGKEPHCRDFSLGLPVTVAPGGQQSGIDFDLRVDHQPCVPSPSTLCLNAGRFTVRGYHAAPNGNIGAVNQAAAITDEAGYFTFFDPANVELVVKVLDACDSYGAFWVFVAGLTDVNNLLMVRDNWAATTQRYDAYGNRPYRPQLDSNTFRGCGLLPPEPEAGAAPIAAPNVPATVAAPPPAAELVPNGCGSDPATSLCLGGRFRVEVRWTTAGGETGAGVPSALTADTGFFHFFSPGNIEVVVKVLDACRADLGNHYWVFAAGMTDVAVTLEVTDTATGEQKIYLSPLGGLFQPILDLGAFATCGG